MPTTVTVSGRTRATIAGQEKVGAMKTGCARARTNDVGAALGPSNSLAASPAASALSTGGSHLPTMGNRGVAKKAKDIAVVVTGISTSPRST
jgi:hypothetical protein